jgi:hypothetical protein
MNATVFRAMAVCVFDCELRFSYARWARYSLTVLSSQRFPERLEFCVAATEQRMPAKG